MEIKVKPEQTEDVVKTAFWLAYEACGGPMGMGVFQAKSDVDKEKVWTNINTSGDYACGHSTPGDLYGDYVFGRMIKLSIRYHMKKGIVSVRDDKPRGDYQGWCHKYKTYQALIESAIEANAAEVD